MRRFTAAKLVALILVIAMASFGLSLFPNISGAITFHTVTFAENDSGSDEVVATQTEDAPTSLTLFADLSPQFVNSGYTFVDWNTQPDGSGTSYSDGETYSFDSPLVLYAIWEIAYTTVTFAENDSGSDEVLATQTEDAATSLTLFADLSPHFVNSGYTFVDWNTQPDGGGTSYSDGETYSFHAPLVLYAIWQTVPEVEATFNAGSGAGSIASIIVQVGTTIVLPGGAGLSNPGYTFEAWNSVDDGTGTAFSPGESVVLSADETFYAQWTPNEYVITFAPNGGTVSPLTDEYASGGTAITLPTPTNANASFDGWFTAATGGTLIGFAGGSYEPSESLTLYAQWTVNQFVVTYAPNGGSVSPSTADYVAGDTALTLPTPSNSDASFSGWFTAAIGGTLIGLAGGSYEPTESLTLYAQWTVNQFVVVYAPNGGSVSPSTADYVAGDTALTLPTPSNSDASFSGWFTATTGGTLVGLGGASYVPTQSLTLYAHWASSTTTQIEVLIDDGTGSSQVLSGDVGSTVALPTTTMVPKPGFALTSWNTAADGTGTSYALGQSVTLTASLTLYPQWTAVGVVAVSFGANGGSGSVSSLSANVGSTVTLPTSKTLVRPGYTLASWNTVANGRGTSYAPGQSVTLTASLKLYAQWKATPTATLFGAVGLFAKDSTALTAGLKQQVARLALAIKAKGYTKVTLYGYAASTDSVALDRAISAARATSVAAYLRNKLSALKVRDVAISSAGEGDAAGKSAESNSRVEVFVD